MTRGFAAALAIIMVFSSSVQGMMKRPHPRDVYKHKRENDNDMITTTVWQRENPNMFDVSSNGEGPLKTLALSFSRAYKSPVTDTDCRYLPNWVIEKRFVFCQD